ncbi:unnamed protein product [Amoebophrya sp. A120]|nr:unnamed protein product [Amoebophrya sp. A120]|eukprot:GSA120T00024632001.1
MQEASSSSTAAEEQLLLLPPSESTGSVTTEKSEECDGTTTSVNSSEHQACEESVEERKAAKSATSSSSTSRSSSTTATGALSSSSATSNTTSYGSFARRPSTRAASGSGKSSSRPRREPFKIVLDQSLYLPRHGPRSGADSSRDARRASSAQIHIPETTPKEQDRHPDQHIPGDKSTFPKVRISTASSPVSSTSPGDATRHNLSSRKKSSSLRFQPRSRGFTAETVTSEEEQAGNSGRREAVPGSNSRHDHPEPDLIGASKSFERVGGDTGVLSAVKEEVVVATRSVKSTLHSYTGGEQNSRTVGQELPASYPSASVIMFDAQAQPGILTSDMASSTPNMVNQGPLLVAILSVFIFCFNSELLQDLSSEVSPLCNLCCAHMSGLLFFPWTKWASKWRNRNMRWQRPGGGDHEDTAGSSPVPIPSPGGAGPAPSQAGDSQQQRPGAGVGLQVSPERATHLEAAGLPKLRAGGSSGQHSANNKSLQNNHAGEQGHQQNQQYLDSLYSDQEEESSVSPGDLSPSRKRGDVFSKSDVKFWQKAAFFSILIMSYNWCFLKAMDTLLVNTVTALYQVNVALCGIFEYTRGQGCTTFKISGTVLCMLGAAIVALFSPTRGTPGDDPDEGPRGHVAAALVGSSSGTGVAAHFGPTAAGIGFSIMAAVGAATYACLLVEMVGVEKARNPAAFCVNFGFAISFCHLVLVVPFLFFADWMHWEELRLPPNLLDGLRFALSCGMAFSVNLCWFYVLYAGEDASLLSNVVALSIPISVFLDVCFHAKYPGGAELAGLSAIVCSFGLFFLHKNARARQSLYDRLRSEKLKSEDVFVGPQTSGLVVPAAASRSPAPATTAVAGASSSSSSSAVAAQKQSSSQNNYRYFESPPAAGGKKATASVSGAGDYANENDWI